METTEKIVEAYCRCVKGWLTLPNVKCTGQYEIDLLAVDVASPGGISRYHIECGVSISGGYSKLTAKDFSPDRLKRRLEQAGQRRTLGYFADRKFGSSEVLEKLREYGFTGDNYTRVVVSWGWEPKAEKAAKEAGIELWDFREIHNSIADLCRCRKTYFTDDTMRTVQLVQRGASKKLSSV